MQIHSVCHTNYLIILFNTVYNDLKQAHVMLNLLVSSHHVIQQGLIIIHQRLPDNCFPQVNESLQTNHQTHSLSVKVEKIKIRPIDVVMLWNHSQRGIF